MQKIMAFILLTLAMNVQAGFSAIVIAYGAGDVPVNSFIDIDAEYVVMSVTLSSDTKAPSKRAKLINQLQSKIKEAADKNPNIDFRQGIISLSPTQKSAFSISKSYGSHSGSSFHLFSTLADKDIYTATQEVYDFIRRIKVPDDTSLNLGNTSLAISSPDNYRTQLLELVKTEIEQTKAVLGDGYGVSIYGLENPVIVRQKNDKQVTLFIDYRIEFSE